MLSTRLLLNSKLLGPVRWPAVIAITAAVLALAGCGDESDIVIVAITRTPEPATAGEATAVSPLPPTAGTATPGPAPSAELPAAPDNLLAGANLLVPYLASGAANLQDCLPRLVAAWGFGEAEGPRCVLDDLDGDGIREFALLVTLPRGGPDRPADVWFFEGADEGHRLLGSTRSFANAALGGTRIVAAAALTGDGLPDVLVSSLSCDADACTTDFLIVSAHRGRFEDLAPDEIEIAGLESVEVEDATGDGRLDLVLRGGVVEAPGAGPQRPMRRTLSWGGLRFFVDDRLDPPVYLIHAIVDADALFASGDLAGARERYEQAAADTTLADWQAESGLQTGRDELVPYALFRAGLAALRRGDSASATELLDRAFKRHQRSLHGLAAATYLATLNQGGTEAEACDLVETFLLTRASEFARIWDYGYANPEHSISGFCR